MCMFGGGGGGQPQIVYKDVYKDAPLAPLPAPAPTMMNSGVSPANDNISTSDVVEDPSKSSMGTSIFKINRDPVVTNDYQDQGLDSGLYY